MCPNNINSLEIETNDRHSNIVTWILVITVTLTIGLSILGARDVAQNGSQQEDVEFPFIPENKFSTETSSVILNSDDFSQEIMTSSENTEDCFSGATLSGTCDVLVPEKGLFGPYDTAVGEMTIEEQVLPTEPLPLCIDDDYLADFYIVVGTYGGYGWVDGCIKVMQAKSDENMWDHIVGCIDITAIPIAYDGGLPCWDYFNLTFTVAGPDPIALDSNHPPDSPLGDFCVWGPQDLDKFVHLKVCTTWEGCHMPDQQFMVILAHKVMSQNKIPNSR